MSLDFGATVQQVDALVQSLSLGKHDDIRRLSEVIENVATVDITTLKRKVGLSKGRPFLLAGIVDGVSGAFDANEMPSEFCVVSSDGSHIDVDRHLPVRCYLINIGGCVLSYGSNPDARFVSRPRLYSSQDDLYMSRHINGSKESVSIEGPLIGLKRAVEEVVGLRELIDLAPDDKPVLALLDGSLVLWGLEGGGYQPFVREDIVGNGLIPALDAIYEIAVSRPVSVAAYTSLPQSREVVNAVRLYLCTKDDINCRRFCSSRESDVPPCDALNGILDRHIFEELLDTGQRSDVFYSNSSISRDFYGRHSVYFYYLNTGKEIARVEIPKWVAEDRDMLAIGQTLILDQCRRGMGYPVTIAESHEQAVINGADRESFKQLIEDTLATNKLHAYTSEKNWSKRMRWL